MIEVFIVILLGLWSLLLFYKDDDLLKRHNLMVKGDYLHLPYLIFAIRFNGLISIIDIDNACLHVSVSLIGKVDIMLVLNGNKAQGFVLIHKILLVNFEKVLHDFFDFISIVVLTESIDSKLSESDT